MDFHIDHINFPGPAYAQEDVKDPCPLPDIHTTYCLEPEGVITLLTNPPVMIQDVLQKDMYHVTYPLNFRNPLTIPSTSPLIQGKPYCQYACTVKPFVNLMNKANFTPRSTEILSYLTLLTDSDFLETLANRLSASAPEILGLLGNVTEQQREAGVMFFLQGNSRCITWSVALPMLYFQHNFFLTEDERNSLNKATFFTNFGTRVTSRDLNTFIQDHLINDVISFGDLRFDAWYNSPHESSLQVAIGAQLTLPTAWAFIQGLSGACQKTFDRKQPMPFFDFQLLVNLGLCPGITNTIQLTELIADYSISALDRLGSILLNNTAGDQHTNFGPTIHLAYEFCNHSTFDIIAEAAYYLPAQEIRLFKTNKSVVNFNRDYANTAQALNNIYFLSQQATDTLYPMAVDIKVHPGMMGHIAAFFTTHYSALTATIGYDFWCKAEEHFGPICQRFNPINPNYITGAPLDIARGTKPAAYQGKIFASLLGEIHQAPCGNVGCSTSRIGIRGDYTLHRRAIGKDFTISIDFIMDF